MGKPLKVGLIGCGNISGQYLETFDRLADIELVAVADLVAERARAVAADRPGVAAATVDELLADQRIEAVVNLTVPAVHADVSSLIIKAGKSVYVEKPLAATTAAASAVLDAAGAAGLVVGCAPDTVLGTGIQTARKVVDDGAIGRPIAASAVMVTPGHERWHPNPDFYYQTGGGPLFDMGPYYLTALVTILGPVARVHGSASALRDTRLIRSGPRTGQTVSVHTPTHVTGVLEHTSGVLTTLTMSFDSVASKASRIEIHGDEGSLSLPDPNAFSGPVERFAFGGSGWEPVAASAGYRGAARGYGLADMHWSAPAPARLVGARTGGELAFHVLDVMESMLESLGTAASVAIRSTVELPAPVPLTDR